MPGTGLAQRGAVKLAPQHRVPLSAEGQIARQLATAFALKGKGYNEGQIYQFMDSGGDARLAAKYQNIGANPTEAVAYRRAGVSPEDAA